MFKSIAKLLLASLLSVTLIIPNTLAFHKNVNFEKKRETIPSSDNRSKKELQSDYCTVEVQDLKKKGKTKEIDKEKDDKKKEPLSEVEKKYLRKKLKKKKAYHLNRQILKIFLQSNIIIQKSSKQLKSIWILVL